MPFYWTKPGKSGEEDFELRNAWVLAVGAVTETYFSYDQLVQNFRELQYFGYRYEETRGYFPQYCLIQRMECGSQVFQRVYPECAEIKINDERFGDSEILHHVKCNRLVMYFIHKDTKKRVYLHILRDNDWYLEEERPVMWLSNDPDSRNRMRRQFYTYITYYFSEPVFGTILSRYGLLD